ncbi:Hypothetical protein PFR_JS12-1_1395 [Propionibacterium freudenreichii]|nr:Hypothetical protein PFR_JS12-2_1393 [Propionibacterium freudenreichii]SCC97363.1 Hypothetical protein PFR_JS12-1_1395 [Propionibacterium freudenreichii]
MMCRFPIGPEDTSYDPDESYRTCSVCDGDCEPSGAEGHDVRIRWVYPQHGVHSVADPFEHPRRNDP